MVGSIGSGGLFVRWTVGQSCSCKSMEQIGISSLDFSNAGQNILHVVPLASLKVGGGSCRIGCIGRFIFRLPI